MSVTLYDRCGDDVTDSVCDVDRDRYDDSVAEYVALNVAVAESVRDIDLPVLTVVVVEIDSDRVWLCTLVTVFVPDLLWLVPSETVIDAVWE